MKQKRYTVDQIIPKLRAADVELGKGLKVPEVCKKLGPSRRTTVGVRSMVGWPPRWRKS